MTEIQSHKNTQDTINSLADKQTEILKMEERMETKLKHLDDRNQKAIQRTEEKLISSINQKIDTKLHKASQYVATQVTTQLLDAMKLYMTAPAQAPPPQLQY